MTNFLSTQWYLKLFNAYLKIIAKLPTLDETIPQSAANSSQKRKQMKPNAVLTWSDLPPCAQTASKWNLERPETQEEY